MSPHDQIAALLRAHGIEFRSIHHAPTRTSEESARVRGEPLENGAKAIVMKVDKTFSVFVISAAKRIDARKIRSFFGARKSRFASRDELKELTGLEPGAVPPFGRPVLDLEVYADQSIARLDRVAFNAASLTDSIIMRRADYMEVASPTVFDFAESDG